MKRFSILFSIVLLFAIISFSSCGLQDDVSPNETPRLSSDDPGNPKVKLDPDCWQERMEQEIAARGGQIVSYDTLGGHAVEAVFPVSGQNRGPEETTCLYASGGYSIPIATSRMLFTGMVIMDGITDQVFTPTSPIVLAVSGLVTKAGPQKAANFMYSSYTSIYGTTSSPTFCLDIISYVEGGYYTYIGSLLVGNVTADYITQIRIRYQFGTGPTNYDQSWNPHEVETCEALPECDGYAPGLIGPGN